MECVNAFEYNGRFYAFSYNDGPLTEIDPATGNMVRIVTNSIEYNDIVNAMKEEN